VLLSVAESKNIHSEIIPKISTGFCGGVARTCGLCGAVSGAIMAISLFSGRSVPGEPIDKSYVPVQKMVAMFQGQFGSTNCRELTGIDLGTEEGRKTFHAANMLERCRGYTEEATKMAMSIIEDSKE